MTENNNSKERTRTASGLDLLEESGFSVLKGKKIGLLVNQASVNRHLIHATDLFFNQKDIKVTALFGPQHGISGTTQDNMIEWQSYKDKKMGVPVYSLYGERRKPTPRMLEGLDALVLDLPDIGSRYYTFVWTARLCMEACAQLKIPVAVADRPNPIGGLMVEGPLMNREYSSFVGLFPFCVRHGMTLGEMLTMMNREDSIGCTLQVIKASGWQREKWADETGMPWVMPSPNMPTLDTASVYPGGCLLEATNVSEGRGTTRPFELSGAPFVEPEKLIDYMQRFKLKGVYLRPCAFEPTFHKFAGKICRGVQFHITDRTTFKPVLSYCAYIYSLKQLYPDDFQWKSPPYEYEYEKMPIDILWGDDSFRLTVDEGKPFGQLINKMEEEQEIFQGRRKKYLIY